MWSPTAPDRGDRAHDPRARRQDTGGEGEHEQRGGRRVPRLLPGHRRRQHQVPAAYIRTYIQRTV